MINLKIGEISSSGQKQGENIKIGKFPRKLGTLGSYVEWTGFKKSLKPKQPGLKSGGRGEDDWDRPGQDCSHVGQGQA